MTFFFSFTNPTSYISGTPWFGTIWFSLSNNGFCVVFGRLPINSLVFVEFHKPKQHIKENGLQDYRNKCARIHTSEMHRTIGDFNGMAYFPTKEASKREKKL